MALVYAIINKETLLHICSSKKVSTDFIINKTKLNAAKVPLWLDTTNPALPTIKQAKTLAACLHIPFAGLYMNPDDIPLKSIPNIKNLRTLQGAAAPDDSSLNIAMVDVLLERDFLIHANTEFGHTAPIFSPNVPNETDPVKWAQAIRAQFSIDLGMQYKCPSSRQFYLYLRNCIENNGVFVHCFVDVPIETARGIAIYESSLPIIGINDEDRPPAKSFTLIHELVHLFKRESSLCNDMNSSANTAKEEIFCNAVAGELLVPAQALRIILREHQFLAPYSVNDIQKIASRFSVSREVIIRRLLDMGEIDTIEYDTYADLFNQEIEQERERQRIAREQGIKIGPAKNVSREAVDRTSPSVSKLLYHGLSEEVYSKQDIARHLNIDQRHIDKFLVEVSKWIK